MSTQTLEQLLQRVADHDRDAFDTLYAQSSGIVFAVLLKILVRRDIAEEALQDVYVKIWRQADGYREARGKALTWITSIARYRALDLRRTLVRETRLPEADANAVEQPGSVDSDPAAAAEWGDDSVRLRACMDELSADQSGSIQLAFLRGYSHSEVADVVGAPVGTVKSWIRRGLGALKRCLGQ